MPAANPSTAQLAALRAYARQHGRTWRAQLHAEWMNACQGISDPGQRTLLQQLRNEFGPRWLKLRGAAAVKPPSAEELVPFLEAAGLPASLAPKAAKLLELVAAKQQQLVQPKLPKRGALQGENPSAVILDEALDVFSAPPVPDAELAERIAKKRGEIEASGLAQWAYQAPACPSCGGALELVKAEDGGEVEEPYFPKYPLRDEPLPRRRRPATFWACSCCEYCEEVQVHRLGAKQPAASAFGKAVR